MPITISEIRHNDIDRVVALWRSQAADTSPAGDEAALRSELRAGLGLSLVARDDDRIVGAILCAATGDRGCVNRLLVGADQPGLERLLVDKVMVKLHAQGIHKCSIQLPRPSARTAAPGNPAPGNLAPGDPAGASPAIDGDAAAPEQVFWKAVRWSDQGDLAQRVSPPEPTSEAA